MALEQQQLEAGLAALESQRAVLGDAVVDAASAGLRARLTALGEASAPAALPAAPLQSLRQVTILFLDIVGSTGLAQHLEPEEVHAALDGALQRFTATVAAHHGKVLQYAGDNLLAAFGADDAHEDDPELAVRCGLALLEQARTLAGEIEREHGHAGFGVRVGIHTGAVLLGGGVDAAGTIRGSAVNIAARMEQSAPAGSLRISHDTYNHVRGVFDVQAQPPIELKGVDEPIRSYLVQRAKPRAFRIATRGIEGVETRMIGRAAELDLLKAAFERLMAERRLAAITVLAEAGVGKSRLLYEFEVWSEARPERFVIFQGRATPHTQGQAYGLLRDILAWRLQIADDDAFDTVNAKLEQGIVPLFEADDGADAAQGHAHLLGHLIGLDYSASRHVRAIRDDPGQIRSRAFHAAAQLLRRTSAAEGAPIVLQLEDLHWADDASLEFLDYVSRVDADVPMLILGFARPTLFERVSPWPGTHALHQRIELRPLAREHSRELANELLKKLPDVPAALRELVIGGAEGNPFYMEELVKMLVDQGGIETGPQRWTLHPEKLLATHVPATLTGVLQARLDGLPRLEKLALQEASVIGHVFWDQALLALDSRADELLPALLRRELATQRPDAALEGLREFVFRHQILHQVTYDTVLRRVRRELHGKVAHWLSSLAGARANDFLGMTAEHYEKAGDAANAAEFHVRAAEHASARFGHAATLEHIARALALLDPAGHAAPAAAAAPAPTLASAAPALTALRWRALKVRERTLDLQGQRDLQRADIDALEALAEAMDDDQHRAEAAERSADLAYRTDDWAGSERAGRRAMVLAEKVGDHTLRLHALHRRAMGLAWGGDPGQALTLVEQGLADARALGLRQAESMCLNALSIIGGVLAPDPMHLLGLDQACLAIVRELGNRRNEAIALGKVGVALANLGAIAPAREHLEQALRLMRSNGDRPHECLPLCALAALASWDGDAAGSEVLARTALSTAIAVQARYWEGIAQVTLGQALALLGRHAEAAQTFEQARTTLVAIKHPSQHDATAGLAQAALALGDAAGALRQVESLIAFVDAGGSLDGSSARLTELICHKVLAHTGDPRAAAWLARAHRELQATAATITDAALRETFLRIPEYAAIGRAWEAMQRSGGSSGSGSGSGSGSNLSGGA